MRSDYGQTTSMRREQAHPGYDHPSPMNSPSWMPVDDETEARSTRLRHSDTGP